MQKTGECLHQPLVGYEEPKPIDLHGLQVNFWVQKVIKSRLHTSPSKG